MSIMILALIPIVSFVALFFVWIVLGAPTMKSIVEFGGKQIQLESTPKQKVFDSIFGIILPIICVLADPIVFGGSDRALLWEYKPFAYLLSFTSIMTLLAFLLWGEKLKWLNGFFCGFFALGGTISLLVGIVLLPFSLIGLIVVIGALGFTPLFSAFVYWRNAIRAYKYAEPVLNRGFLIQSAILSAIFGFVFPYLVNVKVQKGIETIQSGNVQTIQRTTKKLQFVAPIVNPAVIRRTYNNEHDSLERKAALRESYIKIAGKNPMELPWGEAWD